ncbi:hypothetical protein JCM5353_000867 [Sporobolomyces roseus]
MNSVLEIRSTFDPDFKPVHAARDTALLLGPQCAAWQISFVVYGIYVGMFIHTVRGETYAKFAREVKATTWLVFGLVTGYNVLAFLDNFYWMITIDRSPTRILIGWPVDFIMPLSAGLCGLVSQGFLSIRASVLIHRRWLRNMFLMSMFALSLASFIGCILVTVTAFLIWSDTLHKISIGYNNSVAMWLWTSAATDISISIALFLSLKQRVGIVKEADGILNRLIFVALQTAAYTAIPALAGAILSLLYNDSSAYSLIHFAFWMPLPSCYAISLYTTIGTREMIETHLSTAPPWDPSEYGSPVRHPLAEVAPWSYRNSRSMFSPALAVLTGSAQEPETSSEEDRGSSEKERRKEEEKQAAKEKEKAEEEAQRLIDNKRAIWW